MDLSYLKKTQDERFAAHKRAGLPVDQLRRVLDTLYDGVLDNAMWLTKIRSFYVKKENITREHQVYLWLIRNGLTGVKLHQFFTDEGGFLSGMNLIINRMSGRKYSLDEIKIDEAL